MLGAGPGVGAGEFPKAVDLLAQPALPDPLVMLDGRQVTNREMWMNERRPELINLMHFYYLNAKAGRRLPTDLALRALGHAALFQKEGQFHTMDRYHWAAVGSAFVSNYPKESRAFAPLR
jgi:hypothetical protein